jgi:hypothetical protein
MTELAASIGTGEPKACAFEKSAPTIPPGASRKDAGITNSNDGKLSRRAKSAVNATPASKARMIG